jgi:glucose dehydrogenase
LGGRRHPDAQGRIDDRDPVASGDPHGAWVSKPGNVRVRMTQSKRARTAELGIAVIKQYDDVDASLRAVVHEVDVRRNGVTARFLRPDRSRGVVRARTLILAAHAIETPKLMLLSRGREHRAGLGNERDLVGRFLMDHPVQLSWALTPEPLYPFRGPLSTSGIETLRDGPFRARRSAFRVQIGNDGWSWPAGAATVQAYTQATNHRLGQAGLAELRSRFARQLRLASLAEPLPDPRNRVTLAERRDALGIPRPRLSYRTGDYARAGLAAGRQTHQRLFERLGATGVNHADQPFGAGHVMGTCRMGADPRTSVVDAELRVHGYRNCFVISTAVFPTVGTANPTLTLAALSLRAAAAVRQSLKPS